MIQSWKKFFPWLIALSFSIIAMDSVLKFVALKTLPAEGSVFRPDIITLALHKNPGIAFDIEIPMMIIIILSGIIGGILIHLGLKNYKNNPQFSFFCFLITIGALGNLTDRIFYGFTVDYIIIFGRSAINLADLVIVTGVLGLLFSGRETKRKIDSKKNLS